MLAARSGLSSRSGKGWAVDVSVTRTADKTALLVRITATGCTRDRILADLDAIVGVYREVESCTYRVAWHREAALRRFAEQVRAQGCVVAWGGWPFAQRRSP